MTISNLMLSALSELINASVKEMVVSPATGKVTMVLDDGRAIEVVDQNITIDAGAAELPSINWDAVGSQFKWLAVDRGGRAFIYNHKPEVGMMGCWWVQLMATDDPLQSMCVNEEGRLDDLGYVAGDVHWSQSLVQRPVKQKSNILASETIIWSAVPDQYNWLAVDESGVACVFDRRPNINYIDRVWTTSGGSVLSCLHLPAGCYTPNNVGWTNSLEQRPGVKPRIDWSAWSRRRHSRV